MPIYADSCEVRTSTDVRYTPIVRADIEARTRLDTFATLTASDRGQWDGHNPRYHT